LVLGEQRNHGRRFQCLAGANALAFAFYLAYCLEFVLVKEKILINLSIGLGILLSLIFAPNIWHFLILLFSAC